MCRFKRGTGEAKGTCIRDLGRCRKKNDSILVLPPTGRRKGMETAGTLRWAYGWLDDSEEIIEWISGVGENINLKNLPG